MDSVQNHLLSSMNIAVPAIREDCYNLEEFMMWNIMMDVLRKQCEEMIDNLHVDKNNPDIIHPKSYIIQHKNISSFKKLWVLEIPFTSKGSVFDNGNYKPELNKTVDLYKK
jgi:hypothetical protein